MPAAGVGGRVEWRRSDLPLPPPFGLRQVVRVMGPGAILLGLGLGSGDWILGPAATARWGPGLLWICTASIALQALLNTEMARYTLATGEPIFAGFMRTRPGPRFWGGVYACLHLAQVGWAGWALASAGALGAAFLGRAPRDEDRAVIVALGYLVFLAAVAATALGPRLKRTLAQVEWLVMAAALGLLAASVILWVGPAAWKAVAQGFFAPGAAAPALPADPDWWLLAALAAYAGAGGTINATITHWMRDKGFGMAGTVEGRLAEIGGERVRFARDGAAFEPTEANLAKWRLWWRYLRADLWYLWTAGCLAGMALPVLVTAQFAPPGERWSGMAAATGLADVIGRGGGFGVRTAALLAGAGVLAATQAGIVAGYARSVTDIVWTARARSLPPASEGGARGIYRLALAVFTLAGCAALRIGDPLRLILIGADVAALNLVVLSLHTLRVNRALLPGPLRPSAWREAAVLACALFFAGFLALALASPGPPAA